MTTQTSPIVRTEAAKRLGIPYARADFDGEHGHVRLCPVDGCRNPVVPDPVDADGESEANRYGEHYARHHATDDAWAIVALVRDAIADDGIAAETVAGWDGFAALHDVWDANEFLIEIGGHGGGFVGGYHGDATRCVWCGYLETSIGHQRPAMPTDADDDTRIEWGNAVGDELDALIGLGVLLEYPGEAELASAFRNAGIVAAVVGTGGGCEAFDVDAPAGFEILVTDAEDPSVPDATTQRVAVARYAVADTPTGTVVDASIDVPNRPTLVVLAARAMADPQHCDAATWTAIDPDYCPECGPGAGCAAGSHD